MSTLIFGHKNPDTDSCIAATALSILKNRLGQDTVACRLGALNKESEFIYKRFGFEPPIYIEDVKTQIRDVDYDQIEGIHPADSIYDTFRMMQKERLRTVAITTDDEKLLGLVTMQDIALAMMDGDIYALHTSSEHIRTVLEAREIYRSRQTFSGNIRVVAYDHFNEKLKRAMNPGGILIIGDRFDVIETAIKNRVELIIVTGDHEIPPNLVELARAFEVSIFSCPLDTYTTAKRISQCNSIDTIMHKGKIISFLDTSYLEIAVEEIKQTNYSGYPVVDKDDRYLGLISRRNILMSRGKEVILVDHNESMQSAEGIEQAQIIEIYDHHKIGDVATNQPIHFRNVPVGSTSTIIYRMYKEHHIVPEENLAGLLLSGIISDTLFLTSPTTTSVDVDSFEELARLVHFDVKDFAREMFTAGTALGESTTKELFYRDYKLFEVSGKKLGISQIYTLDMEGIYRREQEILKHLQEMNRKNHQSLTMLMVTDIYAKGSYLYFAGSSKGLLDQLWQRPLKQGDFVPGVVSRKKQIVPELMVLLQSNS